MTKHCNLIVLLFAAFCHPVAGAAETKTHFPNVVVLFVDDMGWGDAGCYNPESKIPTPNLDKLASAGIRFTDGHSGGAVCTPSRYGILTGRFAWRSPLGRSGITCTEDAPLIEDRPITLPEMLKSKGYNTAAIGKWHLGWRWLAKDGKPLIPEPNGIVNGHYLHAGKNPRVVAHGGKRFTDYLAPTLNGPTSHGFDYFFGNESHCTHPFAWMENDRCTSKELVEFCRSGPFKDRRGPADPDWDIYQVMPTLTGRTVEKIDEFAEQRKPFFVYYAIVAPHGPYVPREQFVGKSGIGAYGDFVHETDDAVGKVMAALDRNGIVDNTILIFSSDNGSCVHPQTQARLGQFSSGPFRGFKGSAWEGGHRVPFVVRWPAGAKGGTVCEHPVGVVDTYATLAEITGFELPVDSAEDSISFLASLKDPTAETGTRKTILNQSMKNVFTISDGRWKLIKGCLDSGGPGTRKAPPGGPQGQLYDLKRDIGETTNLWEEYPEVVKTMLDLLDRQVVRGCRPGLLD